MYDYDRERRNRVAEGLRDTASALANVLNRERFALVDEAQKTATTSLANIERDGAQSDRVRKSAAAGDDLSAEMLKACLNNPSIFHDLAELLRPETPRMALLKAMAGRLRKAR